MWAFFAMETLVNRLAVLFTVLEKVRTDPSVQTRTREIMIAAGVPPREIDLIKKTPFLKLAVAAPELSAEFAENWLKEFKAIKAFRGQLAHANEVEENQLTDYRNRASEWLEGVLAAALNRLPVAAMRPSG